MSDCKYTCQKEELHPELQSVFFEEKESTTKKLFRQQKSKFFRIKFIFFVCLSVIGFKHYNTMGILGYETFLFDENFVGKIIKNKKRKKLLDIGAGNGSITRVFEKYVDTIVCIEPSASFQKILQKKGYTVIKDATAKEKYDIVTIFNVLDICDNPPETISTGISCLSSGGLLLISMPFPLQTRSWDNRNIKKTNHLGQPKNTSFEAGVSLFYRDFLRKHHLHVTGFTRLPYIVSLPESRNVSIYDNGLFICQKD